MKKLATDNSSTNVSESNEGKLNLLLFKMLEVNPLNIAAVLTTCNSLCKDILNVKHAQILVLNRNSQNDNQE
eukprot:CAMPEP_0116891988 /NCGR_PEP_ID=MMETSP0467-20121206/2300_1 /TAXON_ID=283647 /ORGANISM="Mesodinium pulex, Strain SPMC105" /LENGTH=71 /DNA_ID=CAMNT_0004560845 /DNA_START=1057 /DNA_END=1272 /DNA_ORIENTATION=+